SSEHKSIPIYDGLKHEIFNEASYNQSIFQEIVDWLNHNVSQ
ncbi:lysophospholipase, partial [Vibrio vulnificus]